MCIYQWRQQCYRVSPVSRSLSSFAAFEGSLRFSASTRHYTLAAASCSNIDIGATPQGIYGKQRQKSMRSKRYPAAAPHGIWHIYLVIEAGEHSKKNREFRKKICLRDTSSPFYKRPTSPSESSYTYPGYMSANVALCTCNIEQLVKVVVIKDSNKARKKKNRKLRKKRNRGRHKPTCLAGVTRRFSSLFMCI
jgi:hypothetical protein